MFISKLAANEWAVALLQLGFRGAVRLLAGVTEIMA
jgi:hypothetical protein